jgi:Sucrose synthase
MLELIHEILNSEECIDLGQFLQQLRQQNQQYLLRNDILSAFSDYCKSLQKSEFFYNTSQLGKLIYFTQEIILNNGNACLVVRAKIANQQVFHITEDLQVEQITVEELLDLRDRLENLLVNKCNENPDYWLKVSQQAVERVVKNYTWKIHSTRLLSLAKIYGFWNYTSQENREDMLRYLEILFYLVFKSRAQQLLAQHMQR